MTKEMKVKKCSRDFNYWAILEGFIGDYLRYMNDGKEDGHIDNIFINHMANGNYEKSKKKLSNFIRDNKGDGRMAIAQL